ncbi:MAG: amylo-alpha-1,6-glucosidase, partial [Synergistaceae bacterium]|nr:amylo-alpha-1,6-glucosidase [Synergistaceae bacterium]
MYLGKADVNTYDKGAEREFLVSNGAGSYGYSTVIGANTRSEHGLLVIRPINAKTHTVLISKLEETLHAGNKKYSLSTNRYKDLIYPDGFRYLQEYQGTPNPDMLFVIHSVFLRKSIFMPINGTCTIVRYELLESPETVKIDIRPLFAHRENNAVCTEKSGSGFEYARSGYMINVSGRGHVSHVSFTGEDGSGHWSDKPMWFENLVYEKDAETDKPVLDSLWSPGYVTVEMRRGSVFYEVMSEEPLSYSMDELEALLRETVEKQRSFADGVSINTNYRIGHDMVQSSFHLVTENKGASPAIISGFPSVQFRARDTFIALPGLTLATGRHETARGILENWLEYAGESGIVPSRINPGGEVVKGDIDSGLWFLYAVEKYTKSAGSDFARSKFKELSALLDKY